MKIELYWGKQGVMEFSEVRKGDKRRVFAAVLAKTKGECDEVGEV